MEGKRKISIHDIAVVGLMAALVFVGSMIQIKIPVPFSPTPTRVHFGNALCLLAALLFGKMRGGLAAGFGSFLYDMLDPAYIPQSWVTFITKFAMAFICGAIMYACRKKQAEEPAQRTIQMRAVVAASCGALSYVLMYLLKTWITDRLIYGYELPTVLTTLATKGGASLFNAVIGVMVSMFLYTAIRPALIKSGLAGKLGL